MIGGQSIGNLLRHCKHRFAMFTFQAQIGASNAIEFKPAKPLGIILLLVYVMVLVRFIDDAWIDCLLHALAAVLAFSHKTSFAESVCKATRKTYGEMLVFSST